MRIEGNYNYTGGGTASPSANDSVSRNIRQQIQEVQKQLKELASDKSMPQEEKSERQKELNRQLTELNQRLRQHELDQQKEQREKAAQRLKESENKQQDSRTDSKGSFGTETIQAMAAAETTQAIVQEKEGVRMELSREARQLSNAIKREELEGGVSPKREDLNELYGKIGEMTGEEVDQLSGASSRLEKAKQEEKPTDATDKDTLEERESSLEEREPSLEERDISMEVINAENTADQAAEIS